MPFWKRKKKKDEIPTDFFDTFRDRQPEQGYWYRGYKISKEQYDELVAGRDRSGILNPEEFNEQLQKDWGDSFYQTMNTQTEHPGTVMSDETKQRILDQSGWRASGATMDEQLSMMPLSTGTYPSPWTMEVRGGLHADRISVDNLDVDVLWNKMYEHMRKVIVVCSYCHRPTVISEGNCPKCGAPLPVEFL